jgi:hypothetical protein
MMLGHQNMGMVEEVGPGVEHVKVGGRRSAPFNLTCGTCRNCNQGFTSARLRANPSGQPGAGHGYPPMGTYWGGQRRTSARSPTPGGPAPRPARSPPGAAEPDPSTSWRLQLVHLHLGEQPAHHWRGPR